MMDGTGLKGECMPAFDLFITIFFFVGSAMPAAMIRGCMRFNRLKNMLKARGQATDGTVVGKRTTIIGGGRRRGHSAHTGYVLVIAYPAAEPGMSIVQEFQSRGMVFATATPGMTHIELLVDPDNRKMAAIAGELDNSGNVGTAGLCILGAFMCVFFTIWNGFLLVLAPWCYAPLWSYPLGIGAACFCKVTPNSGIAGVQTIPTAQAMAMAQQANQANQAGPMMMGQMMSQMAAPGYAPPMQQAQMPMATAVTIGGYTPPTVQGAQPVLMANTAGPVAMPVVAAAPDIGTQLAQLADLHTKGVLSDEEFTKAKARVLQKQS